MLSQSKKDIEKEIVVALSRLQYRVTTRKANAQTPYCKLAKPKMADAIFGFAHPRSGKNVGT